MFYSTLGEKLTRMGRVDADASLEVWQGGDLEYYVATPAGTDRPEYLQHSNIKQDDVSLSLLFGKWNNYDI